MKKFDEGYKMMAIKRIRESGKSPAEVARELHLTPSTLYSWMSKMGESKKKLFHSNDHIFKSDNEIYSLRKENLDLKRENTILKEAATYFMKN
ncbi:MAG: Transposase [Pelosinus sp.]|jgi:transposase|nr:Transposase [Pelosinus sp.]